MSLYQKLFCAVSAFLLLFGAHYFQPNFGGAGLELPVNVVVWGIAGILIGIALLEVGRTRSLVVHPLMLWAGAIVAILWLPYFLPDNPRAHLAFQRLLGLTGGWLLICSLFQMRLTQRHWYEFYWLLLFSVGIQAVVCLSQWYLFQPGNWMGYVPGNPPSGVFQQRNVASTFMLFAVVASALIVQSGELKAKWQKPAIFIINALAIWVLVLNSSRIATLSLFVVLVLSAPWLLRKADIKAYRLMLLGIASGLAIAHIIPLLSGAAETANVMRVEREMFADSGRMTIWKVTWELIKEKPWFGWGYGSFEYFYVMKQAELYHAGEISRMMHNMSHPHNELLYWVSEAGLIPVLTIIGVLGWQLVRLASNCREKALFFPSMLVAPVLHCTTELPFYHSALLLLMSGVLLCVASSNTTESTNQSFSCKFTIATSLVSTIVVTSSLFFLASGLQAHQQLGKFIKSEYTDIEALQQIVVPVAISNRYQYYSWKLLLNNSPADTESGRKHIENVCRWSNSRFQDTGKRMYLESQKTALEKLNDTERLRVVYDQITYLFPDSEFP